MSFRAFLAILLCKILRLLSRLLHRGGTAMPGRWAVKVCPNLLSLLARNVKTIAVTGTNGKTSTSRMIEAAFQEEGVSYLINRSGANLMSGIVTEFVMNSTLTGKCRKEYAVIECDEAAARTVFSQLKPRIVLVTNLFRDQLDRYGEVTHTLENRICRTNPFFTGSKKGLSPPAKNRKYPMRPIASAARRSMTTIISPTPTWVASVAPIAATDAPLRHTL